MENRGKGGVWGRRVGDCVGAVICLCQRDDEGVRRDCSAVHPLAFGGNRVTLTYPSPSASAAPPHLHDLWLSLGPGLLDLRTCAHPLVLLIYAFVCVCFLVSVRAHAQSDLLFKNILYDSKDETLMLLGRMGVQVIPVHGWQIQTFSTKRPSENQSEDNKRWLKERRHAGVGSAYCCVILLSVLSWNAPADTNPQTVHKTWAWPKWVHQISCGLWKMCRQIKGNYKLYLPKV